MSADNWTNCHNCDPDTEYDGYGGTFREDYEFYGAEEGTVCVSYSGRCTKCGYGVSFEYEHPIPGLVQHG